MTEAVGMPAEAVAPMRSAPFWSGLESVAHTLPYDDAIMGDLTSGSRCRRRGGRGSRSPRSSSTAATVRRGRATGCRRSWMCSRSAKRRTLEGQTHEFDPEVLAPLLASSSPVGIASTNLTIAQAVVLGGHLLRHHHAPRVEHELAHLRHIDSRQADLHPVEPHVRRRGMKNFSGSAATNASRSSLGNPKPISVSSRENAKKRSGRHGTSRGRERAPRSSAGASRRGPERPRS